MTRKPQTYTTKQVAKLLGVERRTLARWLHEGRFKPEPEQITLGGNGKTIRQWLWSQEDVARARTVLKQQRQKRAKWGQLDEALEQKRWRSWKPKIKGAKVPPDTMLLLQIDDEVLTPEEFESRLKLGEGWVYEQTRHRAKVRTDDPFPVVGTRPIRVNWREACEWLERQAAKQMEPNGGGKPRKYKKRSTKKSEVKP